ncbi:Serine/threonine-protein phosphatase 7 [Cucurbita argyrosperma subsp. argyrosperma]|nr:Serine/threonine-protein phosphatase 7 [Cucurbita argyrosperma subsp. argyrosperma]
MLQHCSIRSPSSLNLKKIPAHHLQLSWPPGATISLQWIHHLIVAFDWFSKHSPPSEFASVLHVSVFDSLILTASKTLLKELNCLRILESSVASSGSTVVVVGDIHGQLHDLLFEVLLRGNHDSKYCTSVYGFEKEVLTKYGDNDKHVYWKVAFGINYCWMCITAHGGRFRSVSVPSSKRSKGKKGRRVSLNPEANGLSLDSLEELFKARRSVLDPPWEGLNLIPGDVLWDIGVKKIFNVNGFISKSSYNLNQTPTLHQ